MKKDEAIKASCSSSSVEGALEEAIKSLDDSRQTYATDKAVWEKKLASTE